MIPAKPFLAAVVAGLDITNPAAPDFQSWANNRTYGPGPVAPDSGPEGLAFAPAGVSPTGTPLLLVGNEISGTVTSYRTPMP
jgi:5'-nucleotidase